MCVGPGTFLWKGTDELPVSLSSFYWHSWKNPQKEEQANSYRAPTSCQHSIYIYISIYSSQLLAQQTIFAVKKLRLWGIENSPKLVRDRVCLIYLTSKNIHFTIQLLHWNSSFIPHAWEKRCQDNWSFPFRHRKS